MSLLKVAMHEIVGLFVDDEFLALATVGVVGFAAFIVKGTTTDPMIAALTLFGGSVAVLVAGVWRTARVSAARIVGAGR